MLNMTSLKDKAGDSSCNVVCTLLKEVDSDVPPLTNFEQEMTVLATWTEAPLIVRDRSCQSYLKQYNDIGAGTSQLPQSFAKRSAKPTMG